MRGIRIISIFFTTILLVSVCGIFGTTPVKAVETLNWPLQWETQIPALPTVVIGGYTFNDRAITMPLLYDVTGDGIKEVFVAKGYPSTTGYGSYGLHDDGIVTCLNGATGAVIWYRQSWGVGNHAVMSIHDLDQDGDMELLVCGYHNTTAYHAQNGNILWEEQDGVDSAYYRHDKPAAVLKLGGVVYVFTCKNSGGSTPTTAGIVKRLGSTGVPVAWSTAPIEHPCYGGLSAADINGDGQIELLLGDRATGVGLSCFKTSDLTMLWSTGIACSTQAPMLIDADVDGDLDILVGNQGNQKIHVVNSAGTLLFPEFGTIPTEDGDVFNAPIYDIDKDGHLEYITACGGSNIKSYDLVNKTLEEDIPNPYYPTNGFFYPPIIADVWGNSDLEIVEQYGWLGTYIFDSNGNCVARCPLQNDRPYTNTLAMTIANMDLDQYNEIVEIGNQNGATSQPYNWVVVRQTGGLAGNPEATAKDQWYTFKRNTLSQYVPYDDPDLNTPVGTPEISNVTPTYSTPFDIDPSFGWVNITCEVTDNVAVDRVYINIANPEGSYTNVSMNAIETSNYYYNSSTMFSQVGNYSYFIWAEDVNDNANISSSQKFSMPPNWDINDDGECTVFDLTPLVSNQYGKTGANGWIREDVDNNGHIQVADLVLVSNHYGESWWA